MSATAFVEYWKVVERKISIRWGTYGARQAEKPRHDYVESDPLGEDLRRAAQMVKSIPSILGFGVLLAGILTTLFSIEAFISRLYTEPFNQLHIVSGTTYDRPLELTILIHFLRAFFKVFSVRSSWLPFLASSGCAGRSPPG